MNTRRFLSADGRLFGRVNLVDATVLLLVFWLIPLTYGAYLLFRPAPARIVAMEPRAVMEGTRQVTVRGEGLRPYLRMMVGNTAAAFAATAPDAGVLQLPPLPPGTYDVVLLDEDSEIHRLPGGLMVEAPNAALVAVGAFGSLDPSRADSLGSMLRTAQGKPMPWGEVVGVLAPERSVEYLDVPSITIADGRHRVRAVLKLSCVVSETDCRVRDTPLRGGALVPISIDNEPALFRIEEVHAPSTARAEVLIWTELTAEEVASLRTGQPPGDSFPARDALRPAVTSLSIVGVGRTAPHAVNVRLRVPVLRTPEGWASAGPFLSTPPGPLSGGRLLRVGEGFVADLGWQRLGGRIIAVQGDDR